jgi:dTDP-4-dehydrorhamnose 3,5-epimerase-like enzyme
MNIIKTVIREMLIIEPKTFVDRRGFFTELYQIACGPKARGSPPGMLRRLPIA